MIKVEGEKVTRIDRDARNVSIPPTVRCIGELSCFNGSLVSLNLEGTNIIVIEKFAFSHCFKLRDVAFPSCLEKICTGSFHYCSNLEIISFPEDSQLREISSEAFGWCKILGNIDFPQSIEFIGKDAFSGCENMTVLDLRNTCLKNVEYFVDFRKKIGVYLPSSVSMSSAIKVNLYISINSEEGHRDIKSDNGKYLQYSHIIFRGNKKIEHAHIRRGVEIIGYKCFHKANLVSITIPASVTLIYENAFLGCKKLKHINFSKNSQLKKIKRFAFGSCSLIKKVLFPNSLRKLCDFAFSDCESLEEAIFPTESKLEEICIAFPCTGIRKLSLPPSLKVIKDICSRMGKLESIYVDNDLYKSNPEGTAVYSKDGSELVCIIKRLKHFEIPRGVKVIKSHAFFCSKISYRLVIPSSVEVIEDFAFSYCKHLKIIEFESGSMLKSLELDSLWKLEDLIINNESFIKREDGVVLSQNPPGIVFVPKHLTELEVDSGIEVIYSNAFYKSSIKKIRLPKSLKKIKERSFMKTKIKYITFEDGTELDFIEGEAFYYSKFQNLKLPLVKDLLDSFSLECCVKSIEFPPNFNPSNIDDYSISSCFELETIICPASSLYALAQMGFEEQIKVLIVEDQ